MAKLPKRIYWKTNFWQRNFILNDIEGNPIGGINFKTFSSDAEAHLNGFDYYFEIKGFLRKYVDIYDENRNLQGTITLKWNSKNAVLKLHNEKIFQWNKLDFWGKEWNMIRDYPDSVYDPIVLSYKETESFLNRAGRINNEELMAEEESIVTLSGLYIAVYLARRNRRRNA
jgi:hypothetical protein